MIMRVLTLGWLACLTAALWIAALTPQAGGYELYLRDAYPAPFWALTIGASLCSAAILLLLAARQLTSRWWLAGLAGIIATNVFVLSLPLWRGYVVSDRADALHHIGYVADILRTGTVGEADFYPGMHFIQMALQTLGGATPGAALILITLLFAVLWTLGPVLLVGRLAGDARATYLAAAFSAPFALLSYHAFALPSVLSMMLLPIFLALHLRRANTRGWERMATVIAEVVLAFLLVYFHPMTTLYLLALLVAFEGVSRLHHRLQGQDAPATPGAWQASPALGMVMILSIAFVAWSFSFTAITRSFSSVVRWLLGEQDRASAAGEALDMLQIAQLPLGDLLGILFNSFGVPVLLLGLACGFGAVLFLANRRDWRRLPHLHFTFGGMFLAALVVTVGMFLISSSERHPIRLLRILVMLAICALAWWAWEAVFRRGGAGPWPVLSGSIRRGAGAGLAAFLLVLIGVGQMNVYAHPRNGQPNPQVTRTEVAGMAWLTANRQAPFKQASILPNYVPRFEAYLQGYDGRRSGRVNWWEEEIWLPSHFYKAPGDCMAAIAPGETTYLALSEAGRVAPLRFPEAVRSLAHVYTAADWQALDADRSVSKLYDNGAFDVWMTNKEAGACR